MDNKKWGFKHDILKKCHQMSFAQGEAGENIPNPFIRHCAYYCSKRDIEKETDRQEKTSSLALGSALTLVPNFHARCRCKLHVIDKSIRRRYN